MRTIHALVIVTALAGTFAALAGPQKNPVQNRTELQASIDRKAGQEAGEAVNTWKSCIQDYRTNRDAAQTQLDQYDAHRVTATNKIELVTSVATAKTAMEKMQLEINDLKAAIVNLKQALNNLKQATQAGLDGR